MRDANLRVLDDPELPRRDFGLRHAAMAAFLVFLLAAGFVLLAAF